MSIDLESIDLDKLFHKTISFITTNKNSTYIPILKTKYDELINQTTNLKKQTTNLKKQIKKAIPLAVGVNGVIPRGEKSKSNSAK